MDEHLDQAVSLMSCSRWTSLTWGPELILTVDDVCDINPVKKKEKKNPHVITAIHSYCGVWSDPSKSAYMWTRIHMIQCLS